jgi:hypothetical protein
VIIRIEELVIKGNSRPVHAPDAIVLWVSSQHNTQTVLVVLPLRLPHQIRANNYGGLKQGNPKRKRNVTNVVVDGEVSDDLAKHIQQGNCGVR